MQYLEILYIKHVVFFQWSASKGDNWKASSLKEELKSLDLDTVIQ